MSESDQSNPVPPDSSGIAAGQEVGDGRYLLKKTLGHGGMGVVWLAHDKRLRELVALKFLPPQIAFDPAALEDLRRETLRSRKLSHPNIVRIHDLHEGEGERPFITMEYVDGPNLHYYRASRPGRVLAWKILEPLVRQFCAALEYAHGEKVVHRDLKPANLMLDSNGRLKLADFGLACVVHDSMTRLTGQSSGGTLNFMSPQQADGRKAQVSDDIYALGATLYDLLTSKPPFYSGDVQYQLRNTRPDPMAQRLADLELTNEIPPEVSAMVMACLAKDPEQRPQSAGAILDWIDSAAKAPLMVPTPPVSPSVTPPAETVPVPTARLVLVRTPAVVTHDAQEQAPAPLEIPPILGEDNYPAPQAGFGAFKMVLLGTAVLVALAGIIGLGIYMKRPGSQTPVSSVTPVTPVTPAPPTKTSTVPGAASVKCYLGMLGIYDGGAAPFHFLTQPNGGNVWSDGVKKILNGKYDMSRGVGTYAAHGWINVPADATVFVEAGGSTMVKIDGLGYALLKFEKGHGVEIELQRGLHQLEVSTRNNGGQLHGCRVKVSEKNSDVELPVFFSEENLKDFTTSLNPGSIEVSGWEGRPMTIDRPVPKLMITIAPPKRSTTTPPGTMVTPPRGPQVNYYLGMLGTYDGGAVPFHLMTQPDGNNVWNNGVNKILAEKNIVSRGAKSFAASGWVNVPEDTTLFIEGGRATTVKLNGLGYDLSNYGKWHGAEAEFKKGIYKVEVSTINNGGQLPGCGVKITDRKSDVELPVFFTDEDLKTFTRSLKPGSVELSGWDAKRKSMAPPILK